MYALEGREVTVGGGGLVLLTKLRPDRLHVFVAKLMPRHLARIRVAQVVAGDDVERAGHDQAGLRAAGWPVEPCGVLGPLGGFGGPGPPTTSRCVHVGELVQHSFLAVSALEILPPAAMLTRISHT